MHLLVAGADETNGIGRRLRDAATARAAGPRPHERAPHHSALRLRDARDEADFVRRYADLVALHHVIHLPQPVVRTTGNPIRRLVSRVKALVQGKLLMFQHDHIAYNQSQLNKLLLNTTTFDHDTTQKQIAELRRRVEELERQLEKRT